jgi:hypothetical protein
MKVTVREHDIGCWPSPSVPNETLIQDGWRAHLLFFAMSKEEDALRDRGVAILECVDCTSTRFGYPNDEGFPEYPYASAGLRDAAVYEIIGSPWAKELASQMYRSHKRIWGGRRSSVAISRAEMLKKHFVIPLKEATFECIASDLVVTHYAKDFDEAFAWVRCKSAEA